MMKSVLAYFLLAVSLWSCAMGYRPIRPAQIDYKFVEEAEGLAYSYQLAVLSSSGNRKSANKESKWPYKLVALKVENKTNAPIRIGTNVKVQVNGQDVMLMEPEAVREELGQTPGLYMLWSLFWIIYSKCENNDCSSVPIPIGVLIGLGNMGVASKAGKEFLAELKANDIRKVEIAPGQTVTGLIGVYAKDVGPLKLKVL